MIYKIMNLLPVPHGESKKNNEETWSDIQKEYGFEFPVDYKEFINAYGTGGINEFLWILSPFTDNENLNIFKKFSEMRNAYQEMKKEFPEKFTMNFFDDGKGLFPWGLTDNGDELYWYIERGSWSIMVIESRYAKVYRYNMGMNEFIFKILSKELHCEAFPGSLFEDSYYYESV